MVQDPCGPWDPYLILFVIIKKETCLTHVCCIVLPIVLPIELPIELPVELPIVLAIAPAIPLGDNSSVLNHPAFFLSTVFCGRGQGPGPWPAWGLEEATYSPEMHPTSA